MPAADDIIDFLAPPESFDPADLDSLGDGTGAAVAPKRRRRGQPSADEPDLGPAAPGRGRLRLRAEVALPDKFKGKRTDRKTVFGDLEEEEPAAPVSGGEAEAFEDDDEDDEGDDAVISQAAGGGLSISGDLEAEYEKMLGRTKSELEIMRVPSAADVAKKQAKAARLKQQLDAWGSLVEMRIHLEGALGLAHQLPVGVSRTAFESELPTFSREIDGAAGEVRELLGSLAALQQGLGARAGVLDLPGTATPTAAGAGAESCAWDIVDSRIQPVLDWALGVADDWKERTRLDTRRSFKVLDQSISTQMQAFADTDAEKLRRRSTPPPGRHHVFGAPAGEQTTGGEELDIYDDRDFYVHLLREVLASGGSAGEESRELQAELQGRRANKRKARADVERRASKGRKIRYVPIERLQNFMAPRPRGDLGGASEAMLKSLFATARA